VTQQLLCAVGAALYGRDWQSPLARDLEVSDRTVRRWVAGTHPPPPGIATDLLRLAVERAQVLDDLAEQLRVL